MGSSRIVYIIDVICVIIIIVAITFKLNQVSVKPIPVASTVAVEPTPLSVDQAFYENQRLLKQQAVIAREEANKSPVSAVAYLVGNIKNGDILIEHNPDLVLPVASMSKLITALVAEDTLKTDQKLQIQASETTVASDTSQIWTGETFKVNELFYPLLLNSSNIAAEVLASSTNRVKFLELMSSYSWEIGMPGTYFADPSGISPNNVSTAKDFFALAQYLYKNRPEVLAITRIPLLAIATTTEHNAHVFKSTHPFVSEPGFLGGKTGHTPEARDTMLTMIKIGSKYYAIVVLASNDRQKDTRYLIDQIKTKFSN